MESWEDRLVVVAKLLQESFLLSTCDRDDSTVAWCEFSLSLSVLDKLESLKVVGLAELVVAIGIAVIHDDP